MKLVKPEVTLIEEKDPFRKIEFVGRTCYKSTSDRTDESARKFFKSLVKREHTAMVEHATFIFEVSKYMYYTAKNNNKYLNFTNDRTLWGDRRYLISGNLRALNESGFAPALKELEGLDKDLVYTKANITDIMEYLRAYEYAGRDNSFVRLVELEDLEDLTENEFMKHAYFTFLFICDRGVSHEIVRHRPASFAQESTRYCNYSKDKFGNELTFVEPVGYEDFNFNEKYLYESSLGYAETSYNELINKHKWTPERARAVLPNSLKTEIVMTANAEEFEHFFDLRSRGTTGAPHPDIKVIADKALEIYENVKTEYL